MSTGTYPIKNIALATPAAGETHLTAAANGRAAGSVAAGTGVVVSAMEGWTSLCPCQNR